ncbi:double zinc ribbon domain-containing protein [Variovorax paradoxus]|uniref:double zinc ribbon domain-containing protein n=1 Tax=Variovorax paradoxus TaxID=34073 RepID=UPI0009E93542
MANGGHVQRGHGGSHRSGHEHRSNRDNYPSSQGGSNAIQPCRSCGAPFLPGANFCPQCGVGSTRRACPNCSTPLAVGALFCVSCGQPAA